IGPLEQQRIATETVGPFSSDMYLAHKENRLTASNFGKIIRPFTPCHNIVKSCLRKNHFFSESCEYGIAKENVAIQMFEQTANVKVENSDDIELFVGEIFRDEKLWREEMLPVLKQFYMECIAPEIVRGNIPKNKRCIDPPYIKDAIKQKEEERRIKPQKRKDSIFIKTAIC
ncbi:hypothetical protein ILUMI_17895, partial [Ignelater luminosus]